MRNPEGKTHKKKRVQYGTLTGYNHEETPPESCKLQSHHIPIR